MKAPLVLALALLVPGLKVIAQDDVDALRYSQYSMQGTSRFNAMSGAFGALGGDFTAISSNPGGLGVYRKSEITLSPCIYSFSTTAEYLGNGSNDLKSGLNFNNFGIVLAYNFKNEPNRWNSIAFSIGYNRLNNFNNQFYFSGNQPIGAAGSSLLDKFVENSNISGQGVNPDRFSEGAYNFGEALAYDAKLMYAVFPDTNKMDQYYYTHDLAQSGYGQNQKYSASTAGAQGQTSVSAGANYGNKLFLGATINFSSIRYRERFSFTESDTKNRDNIFSSYTYKREQSTNGSGINLKMGAILKPTEWLRMGAALQSPTWYTLTDVYSASISADYDVNIGGYSGWAAESPEGSYSYAITTPSRANLSLGLVSSKIGILSVDYELVNYSSMNLSDGGDGDNFHDINDTILNKYRSTGNIRIGGEFILNSLFNLGEQSDTPPEHLFTLRGGYAILPSPFKNENDGVSRAINSYSFGLGYRKKHYFLDFAVVNQKTESYYIPYRVSGKAVNGATYALNRTFVSITAGLRF